MDPGVLAALITGTISTAAALMLFWLNKRAEKATSIRVAELEKQTKDLDARRDYEYRARIRLYENVKPLMFRCAEACQPAQIRIERILRGDIEVIGRHVDTTVTRLFAPLVYVQEIQSQLTSVDLALDDGLRRQYVVARELSLNLTHGKAIAAAEPPIEGLSRGDSSSEQPREYLTFAQLERVVSSLTVSEDTGGRPMRQSEFEDAMNIGDAATLGTSRRIEKLFAGAGPSTSPALWRLLLAQASLMHILSYMVARDDGFPPEELIAPDAKSYCWADDGSVSGFGSQVRAVQDYLASRLTDIDDVFLKRVIPREN